MKRLTLSIIMGLLLVVATEFSASNPSKQVLAQAPTKTPVIPQVCPENETIGVYIWDSPHYRGNCFFFEGNVASFYEVQIDVQSISVIEDSEHWWRIYVFSEENYGGEWLKVNRFNPNLADELGHEVRSMQAHLIGPPQATHVSVPAPTRLAPRGLVYLPFLSSN